MAYAKLNPTDRVVQHPSRYILTNVSGTTYDLARAEGTVTVQGTAINATSLKHFDDALFDQDASIGVLSNLTTTEKTNLVGAINEVDGHADTNLTNITNLQNGWNSAGETWTYVSTDDPTGVFKVNADVTTKYSLGMRFKFTNGGNTIFCICTKISAFNEIQTGYTHITYLHEINPSTSTALHLMVNSAITDNYYSNMKVPFGFPMSPTKWTVFVTDTSARTKNSPVQNTWYYSDLGSINISIPIGLYRVKYSVFQKGYVSTEGSVYTKVALSTSTTSNTNTVLTTIIFAGSVTDFGLNESVEDLISLTSKTPYYLIAQTVLTGQTTLGFDNSASTCIIKAECAYL